LILHNSRMHSGKSICKDGYICRPCENLELNVVIRILLSVPRMTPNYIWAELEILTMLILNSSKGFAAEERKPDYPILFFWTEIRESRTWWTRSKVLKSSWSKYHVPMKEQSLVCDRHWAKGLQSSGSRHGYPDASARMSQTVAC
jgi:hypothetical protein